jgi:hypothetical protein
LLFNSGIQKRGKSYPFWIGEGLAMMFESADSQGRAGPSLVNEHRLSSYRRAEEGGRLIRLSELLEFVPRDSDSVEVVAARYAQAWALTHYLWNKQTGRLASYLKKMEEKDEPEWDKLFAACFGEDVGAVEAAVKAWVEGMPAAVARP